MAGCVLTFIESFQLFSALEELELKRRNPASELPIKWNQGVVNQENPENQLGRDPVRKSDNKMRTEHLLPLLAGKYTSWQNLKLLGFPHKNIHSYTT